MEAETPENPRARCYRVKYYLLATATMLDPEGSLTTLAFRLGCSHALLHKLVSPSRNGRITAAMARKVEEVSGGHVTRRMLRPDLPETEEGK